MKNKKLLILSFLLLSVIANAQEKGYYFNINAGGGLHGLKYDLYNGDVKNKFGYSFNVDYSYFFNSHWGLNSGLGVQSAKSVATLNYTNSEPAIDSEGVSYEFRTNISDWEEEQKAIFLDIPLGLEYHRQIAEKTGLLASVGVKISVPLTQTFKVTNGSVITTGYYQKWNVELSDMPQHGFATITDRPSGDLKLNTATSIYANLGSVYRLSEKSELYIGSYLNYGINNLIDAGNVNIYTSDGDYTNILSSNQTDKVNLISFGLKAGIRFHAKKRNKTIQSSAPSTSSVTVRREEPIAIARPEKTVDIAVEEPKESPEVKPEETVAITETVKKPDEVAPVVEITASEIQANPYVAANDDEKPATPEAEVVKTTYESYARANQLADTIQIKFVLNSDSPVNNVYDNEFKELADILKANPNMKVCIQGHTCNLASRTYNFKVGMERAMVGKRKLIEYGVYWTQIKTETKAFDEPLVPNNSEENRAKNRRLKIIIE